MLSNQLEGTNLRRYLHSFGSLAIDQAVSIARDVALLLGEMHQQNLVHSDVNPRNIILLDSKVVLLPPFSFPHVKVPDFRYYAPEQAKGETVAPTTDVYSLGIVTYEMLTGRIPFEGNTPVAVAMQHMYGVPVPLSHFREDVSPGLEKIVLRCLEKAPEMRFRDGSELAEALSGYHTL